MTSFKQEEKIPAYGFGAQATSAGPLPYIFPLDRDCGQFELENIDVSFSVRTYAELQNPQVEFGPKTTDLFVKQIHLFQTCKINGR